MPQVHSCIVCHAPGEGYFFDVFSCRCCAAFFRRSIKEGKEYYCRSQNECPISEDGMRNSCRACRFKRCIEAGMSTKKNGSRIGQKRRRQQMQNVPSSSSSNSSSSLSSVSPVQHSSSLDIIPVQISLNSSQQNFATSTLNVPIARRIEKEISIFKGRLRAICVQHLGLEMEILLGNTFRRVTHNECAMLDRISAPIYLEFVKSELPQFCEIFTKEQKIQIMRDFICHFGFVAILDMTMEAFPDRENLTEMVFYPGCVMDTANDEFYDAVGIGAEEQKKMTMDLLKEMLNIIVHRYKPLAVSPLEFAAMVGIILWHCVNRACENRFEAKRNALFEELHSLVSLKCHQNSANSKFDSIPIRFGKLMTLLWELTNKVDKDFNEMIVISNVFLDKDSRLDYTNIWDNIV